MSDETIRDRYDVAIAGARCAGASTAMLLARRGYRVLVVDPSRPGSDTLSTHALMRGGVLQLHRWGLLDRIREAGTPAVRTTTFHYGTESVEIPIKPGGGVDALYAPRRTLLDAVLAEGARAAGARVVRGLAVDVLLRG
ncbi:MAG: NAD(P)/FAD-dependent oxidoreductase, partial [Gemmatimonadetes bacterium]|nr:NAD(P)/FAD-dependent oxidoreductase [Gemmatimonadota bacterium]NIR78640.1 NAD(P)/FAD-dependent oxidoreductase [Gemmatimonadota bacterium]NIT87258.1 NAD(P)/FAD-dependent oxidoreductase [Gemmatimonadota bacterium]NIU31101.1 NAD(P)/FAD-dependent oxidoreductase [Gemmatimonadota bacterium]NIU35837.1 NAD(P)/FAD-dependent oxidoreductase [Gemmatimonadota bacterium]